MRKPTLKAGGLLKAAAPASMIANHTDGGSASPRTACSIRGEVNERFPAELVARGYRNHRGSWIATAGIGTDAGTSSDTGSNADAYANARPDESYSQFLLQLLYRRNAGGMGWKCSGGGLHDGPESRVWAVLKGPRRQADISSRPHAIAVLWQIRHAGAADVQSLRDLRLQLIFGGGRKSS